MRIVMTISLMLLAAIACTPGMEVKMSTTPSKEALNSITIDDLKANLTYISSDEMKGRDTGSPELKIVAKFLADKLEKWGYKGMNNGSFMQPITMYRQKLKHETGVVVYGDKTLSGSSGEEYFVIYRSNNPIDVKAPVYYVDGGILNDSIKQFDESMVKGKWLVRRALTEDEMKMGYGDNAVSSKLSRMEGVVGVINLITTPELESMFDRYKGWLMQRAGRSMDLNKKGVVTILAKPAFINQILQADGLSAAPEKAMMMESELALKMESEVIEKQETQNVVGWLQGTDPSLNSEYVAYGSHMDHTGWRKELDKETGDSVLVINNGADDDGSGTVSVLQIAKAFSKDSTRRSVMIIFHTGEEKGLLGSAYYADNPLKPMENMVAMFNMDMVGRSKTERDEGNMNAQVPITDNDEMYLVGADRISTELHNISEETNNKIDEMTGMAGTKFRLNYLLNNEDHPARIYYRSDHWNYAKNGVPIIFYFDGIHVDYHKPTDTVEKIDFDKLRDISKLAFATGYHVANKDKRLVIDQTE